MTTKPIRYAVTIDEEGYPVFDGLRVQDEELLRTLLSGIRRLDDTRVSSPLVTECEGETCVIQAFDAPLVAQTVDAVTPTQSEWIFPGQLKMTVAHAALSVDTWHRLHTYVERSGARVPSVLSRKAQAAFLHRAPVETLSLPPWRSRASETKSKAQVPPSLAEDVTQAERWNEAFRNQTDGWEQGMPSPVLAARKAAVAKVVSPGAKLLVPGCGRGHDAELLATWGYQVTALDFSVEAEREFRKLYPDSKVTFIRGDVFEFLKAHAKTFQAIFEHTIFCAIDPLRRPDYLSAVHQSLVESGHWLGVFFMLDHEGGPPFGMTQWELREMTKSKFAARTWEFAAESTEKRRFQELWCVFQRR